MKNKMLALGAITALALSAHAQVYNWTLTTSGVGKPGNGSGTLTLTGGGIVTAMSGTVGGGSVTLLPVNTLGSNDNALPLNNLGLCFEVGGSVAVNVYWDPFGGTLWGNSDYDSGIATFTYTLAPVPEPHEYAMVAGAGMVGFAVWRRRAQRAAKA